MKNHKRIVSGIKNPRLGWLKPGFYSEKSRPSGGGAEVMCNILKTQLVITQIKDRYWYIFEIQIYFILFFVEGCHYVGINYKNPINKPHWI